MKNTNKCFECGNALKLIKATKQVCYEYCPKCNLIRVTEFDSNGQSSYGYFHQKENTQCDLNEYHLNEKAVEIVIERVSGQSFYKDTVFKGKFLQDEETIAKCVATILSLEYNEIFCNAGIVCQNVQTKFNIMTETIRQQPKFSFVDKELVSGRDFGYNIKVVRAAGKPAVSYSRKLRGDNG